MTASDDPPSPPKKQNTHIWLPFLDEPHGKCARRQIGVIAGSDGRGMKASESEG